MSFLYIASFIKIKIEDIIYGAFAIKEPVLITLINSKPLQRLKGIEQYGIQKETFVFLSLRSKIKLYNFFTHVTIWSILLSSMEHMGILKKIGFLG